MEPLQRTTHIAPKGSKLIERRLCIYAADERWLKERENEGSGGRESDLDGVRKRRPTGVEEDGNTSTENTLYKHFHSYTFNPLAGVPNCGRWQSVYRVALKHQTEFSPVNNDRYISDVEKNS